MSDEKEIETKPQLTLTGLITMPWVKFLGMSVAFLGAGWKANSYVNELKEANNKVVNVVDSVASKVELMRADLKAEIAARTSDRYTRTDHIIWAFELEKANNGKVIVPAPPARQP